MISEAKQAANARYDAKTARYYSLKLNQNTDSDILNHLAKKENIQGYLKQLIRNDIKGGTTMNTYKIRPEYLDLWEGGDSSDPDRIITEDDVKRLAESWGKSFDELLEQLIPQ